MCDDVEIGRGGEIRTLMSKKQEEKEPKFEDFPQMDKDGNPTGMTIKGMFTGTDIPYSGVALGYEPVGKKSQFKPEDPNKRAKEIENKDIARMVADRKALYKRKNRNYDIEDLILIDKGIIPKDFTKEDQTRLDSIERKLSAKGFNFNIEESNSPSKLLQDLNAELTPSLGKTFTEKEADYYYSDKGKSDIQKMTKEFEAKFPPGTYDPLSIDMEREQLWFKLQNKYFQKDSDGKPSKVARAYTSKYNFDIEKKYGRDGTLSNPTTTKAKKGSFWE